MPAIILKRVLLALPTLVAITALLFIGTNVLLGSPALMMLGQDATPSSIAALNAKFGFDRPLLTQYLHWMLAALQGDFGQSYATQEDVMTTIRAALPVTLELGLWSIALPAAAAIVLNTVPVGRRALDALVTAASLTGLTVPNFMLGVSMIYIFSVVLGWLPSTGWVPWGDGIAVHIQHLVMPVFTLSLYYFGVFSLVYRAEYQNVGERLFIQVARAKGLSEGAVVFKHALPNAILPVITFMGISLGQLTGGAVVVETVFSMPGIGRLFVNSIGAKDYPVILAIGIVIIVGVVVMNLLADLAYTLINPQIRLT